MNPVLLSSLNRTAFVPVLPWIFLLTVLLVLLLATDGLLYSFYESVFVRGELFEQLGAFLEKCESIITVICRDLFSVPVVVGRAFSSEFQPRQARFWDLYDVARFDHRIFPKRTTRWSTLLYLLRLHLVRKVHIFVVREKTAGRIIGTAYLTPLPGSHTGFVSHVGVDTDYRRQGLAKLMMVDLILPEATRQGMNRLVLTVAEQLSHVRQFYRELGFIETAVENFEVAIPDGDVAMSLQLAP